MSWAPCEHSVPPSHQTSSDLHRRLTIWIHHSRPRHELGHTPPLPSSFLPCLPSPSSLPPLPRLPHLFTLLPLPFPLPLPLPLPLFPFLLPLHSPLPILPTRFPRLVLSHPHSPLPVPSFPLPLGLPSPPTSANDAHPLRLPPPPLPLFPPPLALPVTPPGMMIGAPKMMTFFSVSNAMNDFDPVGGVSPAKCSALNLRSALAGQNFLNYSDLPLHDDRL